MGILALNISTTSGIAKCMPKFKNSSKSIFIIYGQIGKLYGGNLKKKNSFPPRPHLIRGCQITRVHLMLSYRFWILDMHIYLEKLDKDNNYQWVKCGNFHNKKFSFQLSSPTNMPKYLWDFLINMKLHCASCFLNEKPVRKLVRILCVCAHIYYFNFDSKHKDIQKIKYNSRSIFAYVGEVIASSMRILQSFYQRLGNLRKKKKKKVLKSHIDPTIQ